MRAVTPLTANPFDTTAIRARGAVVYDISRNETIYRHNADTVLPLASLTKVMTAIVAGRLNNPADSVTISAQAIAREGNQGLFAGEVWRPDMLSWFTLISSSNDGAYALGEHTGREEFIQQMNEMSTQLDLHNTYFFNETGLDVSVETSGGYSTAEEFAKLFAYGIKMYPGIFAPTRHSSLQVASLSGAMHRAKNTNEDIKSTLGIIASKTGYTKIAGGNLAVIFDVGLNRPMVAVVLGSSAEERFSDIEALINASIAYATGQ